MNCHICKSPTISFVNEKTSLLYYHCLKCEYIFKSPEYYQDFTQQKERYNLHQNDEEDAGYQAYFRRFLDFVLPWVGEAKSALDFGCGVSLALAHLLDKEGIACDAYDPIYHPHAFKSDKKYDLIVSTEVFEHLHDPKMVFASLVERLEEGGYLALQTQFHPNTQSAFKQWYYPQDPTHIVFFRVKTFEVLAKMYGCKVLEDNAKNMVVIQKISPQKEEK